MGETVEVYGVVIDTRCAALLEIALNADYSNEREDAIRKLGKIGCYLALGIVAMRAKYSSERELARELLAE